MSQPEWKFVANLGDEHPIDYGGLFVYEDATGVYPPECELLESPDSDQGTWVVYRFVLEPCTFINGILSDNQFHPDKPAWFAGTEEERKKRPQDSTYLLDLCTSMSIRQDELVRMFCSDDSKLRAQAWRIVGEYHGFENLDSYPLKFKSRAEVEERYKHDMPNRPGRRQLAES